MGRRLFLSGCKRVGIRTNSAADTAAKDGLGGDISDELISSTDLQTLVNIHLLELWLPEWDTFPHTKLHKTLPRLNGYITWTNRREEMWYLDCTLVTHITRSCLLQGPCDELNTFYLISLKQEELYSRFLFKSGYLKEIHFFFIFFLVNCLCYKPILKTENW